MTTLYLDTETFSTVPLKHGTHRYAEQSEIMLFQYAIDDGPVLVEEFDADHAQALIDQADKIIIQNSYFDRTLLSYSGVVVPVDKIEDTMVMALAHSLPGGLDPMCEVLAVPADKAKIKDGKKLINLFCKPRPKKMKLRRATKATHPKEWAAFIEYGRLDVEAMRECYKRLPRWNMTPSERKLWQLDQIINDRGILIDLHLAREALRAAAQAQQILSDRIDDMTDGVVKSARQRAKVKDYLESVHEFVMEDMTKAAVKAALANPNITGEMREMLEIRLQASATSPAKYTVLVNGTSTFDGRLRGILQFCGASRTSRWGGRLFQPQNLPRPTMKQKVIELGIRAIKLGMEAELFENVMELLASAVRGTLIAPKGRKLVISDLSNIEGRVSAWISGETWKVKAFKEFDRGIGHDIYVLAYARAYGVRPEDVIADMEHAQGLMRLIGKVMELACIAEGQQILTDSGLKAIEDVLLTDRVWDGVDFVSHDGVVYRGEKEVGTYQGLEATPDHFVFVDGLADAIPFEQAAARGSHLKKSADGWAPLWVGDDNFKSKAVHETLDETLCCDKMRRVRTRAMAVALKSYERIVEWVSTLLAPTACSEMVGEALLCGTAALRKQKKQAVPSLRWARDCIQIFFSDSYGRVGGRSYRAAERQGVGPQGQRQGLRTRKYLLVDKKEKHPKLSNKRTAKTYDIRNCGPRHRFTANGRLVHNCSYGGAIGAFTTMAANYGLQLPEEKIIETVRKWRKAHPAITSFWYDVEWACRQAIRNKGQKFHAGQHGIVMDRVGKCLRIKMPSGSYLSYHNADEDEDGKLVYDGVNQYTKQWERIYTYGPKIFENIVQKIARDILAAGMTKAEDAGYDVCLHVHDELITETDDNEQYSHATLSGMMAAQLSWTLGLPLAAKGHEAYAYSKG